jgi:hypothetical protein
MAGSLLRTRGDRARQAKLCVTPAPINVTCLRPRGVCFRPRNRGSLWPWQETSISYCSAPGFCSRTDRPRKGRASFWGRAFYSRHFFKVVGLATLVTDENCLDCYSVHFLKSWQFDRYARLESPTLRFPPARAGNTIKCGYAPTNPNASAIN